MAHTLDNVRELGAEMIEKLQALRSAYGVSGVAYPCQSDLCAAQQVFVDGPQFKTIVWETLKALGGTVKNLMKENEGMRGVEEAVE